MIYLDNAATTYRKPQSVIDAVCHALMGTGNAGRGASEASLNASRLVYETRKLLSEMFGGYGPSQVAFTNNATEALNIAIMGSFRPGDHVITTVLEHNSVLRPLYLLEGMGVELTIVGCDARGRVNPEDIRNSIRNNTRGVVCTHASNLTGNVVDIAAIGKIIAEADKFRALTSGSVVSPEERIRFIVDASQSAGFCPIDMHKMNIDILCITGHKSLMGPQGTGAILVREGIVVRPLKVGGTGIRTFDKNHPTKMPTALEAGTLNAHGIAGLNAALKHLNEVGIAAVRDKELKLARRFYRGIQDIPELKCYGDYEPWDEDRKTDISQTDSDDITRTPIVSVNLSEYDSGLLAGALLTEYGIQTRSGGHCAPLMHEALGTAVQGAVRFSFNWFNTEEEIDTAIRALHEIADED